MEEYLAEIKQFHKQSVEPYTGKPVGCSEREILVLEQKTGFVLPEAYKQFLQFMGKDNDGVLCGSGWFLRDIGLNDTMVIDLLEENAITFQLPEHYFLFFSHQGYMAAWFELPRLNENPPVFFFSEGKDWNKPQKTDTFTTFLFDELKGLASRLPYLYRFGEGVHKDEARAQLQIKQHPILLKAAFHHLKKKQYAQALLFFDQAEAIKPLTEKERDARRVCEERRAQGEYHFGLRVLS